MSEINIEEINNLNNTIKSNMRSNIQEYKSKSRSINSRLESIVRSYSGYRDVTSKPREIIRDLIGDRLYYGADGVEEPKGYIDLRSNEQRVIKEFRQAFSRENNFRIID